MKVSIITVCFNSKTTLSDTIESVIRQSYKNIEFIIIDGASIDGTLDIINSYREHIAISVSEADRGIYDAMNKGISYATGDIVGILNSDDVFFDNYVIENIVDEFSCNPKVNIVCGHVVFTENINETKITRFYSSKKFAPWKLRFGWMPPHPATFVRANIYHKYGNYKLHYEISSDYEIFIRWLMIKKLKFKLLDKVLVKMRPGGASNSSLKSNFILNKEIVMACRENGIYTNFFFLLFKIPFKLLERIKKPTPYN